MTKAVLATLLGLLATTVAGVLVRTLGLENARFEIAAILVVYACIALNTAPAALCSFASGYLFDLMTGHPTWLYTLVAMLTFVVARVVVVMVDVRGPWGFAALCAVLDVVHQLFAYGVIKLFSSRSGGPGPAALAALAPTALLTGLAALALYPAFHRLNLAFDREESSLLR